MRFGFSEDQKLFQATLAELLTDECHHEALAAAWETDAGWVPGLWEKLAAMGVTGMSVPEEHGGIGLDDTDLVLLLEEAGRAACPEPLAETVAIATPLLAEVGGAHADTWLPKIAGGEARAAIGLERERFVADAAAADLLILQRGDALHAVPASSVKTAARDSVDGARRLYAVEWTPSADTLLADGDTGHALGNRVANRAALAAAAQLVGLGSELIRLTVEYAKGRVQFGQPIGAFQAVKHHIANAYTQLELARPTVYWASNSVAKNTDSIDLDVSTAKALASDAAHACFRAALQCHGAIAYTYEYQAHMWMKRVLVLREAYGSSAWHRRRAARSLIDG
ncbi:MAG: acyl-CoA/acyl-ACP dehydrogenase [Myxococcales bacterium]|nr:acyl-CoA/acyl-ACP dehydrogenase [Myxococcales bacterium]